MFGFSSMLGMVGTYEQRKVANYKEGNLIIDTCRITDDQEYPYETAVKHPEYNDNDWVIVEQYATKEESEIGHNKWIEIMTGELPEELPGCIIGDWKLLLGEKRFIKRSN